jgi:triphosphoribosyl-dephospho-CoA synthase
MIAVAARPTRAGATMVRIGRSASRALLRELVTWPKPGLVSLVDNGSHDDMRPAHFVRSARVLRHYFTDCARAGGGGAGFGELRRLGVAAEVAMTRATGGVNAHRGAIFALGLLAAAAGARPATTLGAHVRTRWGEEVLAHRRDPASHGSHATRRLGMGGAQAEAAAGFPSVYAVALPAWRRVREAGGDANAAAVHALFALVAVIDDTNLVHRGGEAGLQFAQRAAREFLDGGGMLAPDGLARALGVHRAFVARRLSPGGSADLLAAALLVNDLDGAR